MFVSLNQQVTRNQSLCLHSCRCQIEGLNKRGGWADFFSYVKKKGGQNANSLLLHENLRGGSTKSVEKMSETPRLLDT